MPTGRLTAVNWQGLNYMPIRLKRALQLAAISQTKWCESVLQFDGRPLSKSAGDQILNWNNWPVRTPVHSIQQQTEKLLAGLVDTAVLETLWEIDEIDSGRMQHPVGAHASQHLRKKAERAPEEGFHLEPEMLTAEALSHFALRIDPFQNDVTQESDVYTNKQITHVRTQMYTIAKFGGLLSVISESGGGKTTVRRALVARFMREKMPIVVITPKVLDKKAMTADHICEAIIRTINPDAKIPRSKEAKADFAERLLAMSLEGGVTHTLMIEEGQDVTNTMFKMLKRLWEMEKGFQKLLSIILVGQTELDRKLDTRTNNEIREFINRCSKVYLPPLDNDLEQYIAFKLKRIGASAPAIFEADAYDALREKLTVIREERAVSLMYPLYINNMVTKAMNACAQIGVKKVNRAVVKGL